MPSKCANLRGERIAPVEHRKFSGEANETSGKSCADHRRWLWNGARGLRLVCARRRKGRGYRRNRGVRGRDCADDQIGRRRSHFVARRRVRLGGRARDGRRNRPRVRRTRRALQQRGNRRRVRLHRAAQRRGIRPRDSHQPARRMARNEIRTAADRRARWRRGDQHRLGRGNRRDSRARPHTARPKPA